MVHMNTLQEKIVVDGFVFLPVNADWYTVNNWYNCLYKENVWYLSSEDGIWTAYIPIPIMDQIKVLGPGMEQYYSAATAEEAFKKMKDAMVSFVLHKTEQCRKVRDLVPL